VFVVMRPGSGHDATAGLHGASILGVMSTGADTETFVVRGSGPIKGTVHVPGAKNSVLKLMATTLLTDGTFELTNVPDIVDVTIMGELLSALGVNMRRPSPGQLLLTNTGQITPFAPYELVKKIRASINVLGPLLTRCGEVRLSMPGGDDFGARPIDMHIDGLKAMGAEFRFSDGYLEARCERLHGADITFDFPSVGATENLLTAAVFAKGRTTIDNCAREPEITDLCNFLSAMGADVSGIGTSTLTIEGVERDALRPVSYYTVPDRIQAATYLAATAVSNGELNVLGIRPDDMTMLLDRFSDMGLQMSPIEIEGASGLHVAAPERLRSIDIATLPYPGIATDYKPLIITMLSVADGVGIVTENLYPGRFRYVEELQRLGADISTTGHHAVIRGVPRLSGAEVQAHDIRAGAAMVVAGLAAEGETTISGVHHIDRGYDDLVGRLSAVGADIRRIG
jgi:UDP-N-acetylglucosamine 1-carboxyvinyltransferase